VVESPSVFRILLPAKNLDESRKFYETLLGVPGRAVAPGRVYFDCGTVIVGVLDYSGSAESDFPRTTESVYFSTERLEELHRKARALGSTVNELLHGDPKNPMGEIAVRPWGERSFYAQDPSGNPLCFVDASTRFTGTPAQIEALRRATSGSLESRVGAGVQSAGGG
jgi:catechol 2,3-dioxygenase-like lactoylglutathione lyase family enzyme